MFDCHSAADAYELVLADVGGRKEYIEGIYSTTTFVTDLDYVKAYI